MEVISFKMERKTDFEKHDDRTGIDVDFEAICDFEELEDLVSDLGSEELHVEDLTLMATLLGIGQLSVSGGFVSFCDRETLMDMASELAGKLLPVEEDSEEEDAEEDTEEAVE